MRRLRSRGFWVLAITLVLLLEGFRRCSEFEIIRIEKDVVLRNAVEAPRPWISEAEAVSQILRYRHSFDIDSNDSFTQFWLDPTEATRLFAELASKAPKEALEYRCDSQIGRGWTNLDYCDFATMQNTGFHAFTHQHPPTCQACPPHIDVFWLHPKTGEVILISAPKTP